MARETIFTCAVPGSPLRFHNHRNLPIVPAQVAAARFAARAAERLERLRCRR